MIHVKLHHYQAYVWFPDKHEKVPDIYRNRLSYPLTLEKNTVKVL